MSMDIRGYLLKNGMTTANAGMCQWGFAHKEGHEYFIKEFLSPKYPLDEGKLGAELTKKMRSSADAFYEKKCVFYNALAKCRSGNNVVVLEFFRHGAKYYAVTDKVSGSMLSVAEVAALSDEKKYILTKAILYSVASLHTEGIVHSDLRPENILIKKTQNGCCTAKIIDFDAGFIETDAPDRIEGSQNYFSPEAVQKTNGDDVAVTTKADVWALGLLLHQYWCGKMPAFSEKYHYASEAVLNGDSLKMDGTIPLVMQTLIGEMLCGDYRSRPTAEEAWKFLCKQVPGEAEEADDGETIVDGRNRYPDRKPSADSLWAVPDLD